MIEPPMNPNCTLEVKTTEESNKTYGVTLHFRTSQILQQVLFYHNTSEFANTPWTSPSLTGRSKALIRTRPPKIHTIQTSNERAQQCSNCCGPAHQNQQNCPNTIIRIENTNKPGISNNMIDNFKQEVHIVHGCVGNQLAGQKPDHTSATKPWALIAINTQEIPAMTAILDQLKKLNQITNYMYAPNRNDESLRSCDACGQLNYKCNPENPQHVMKHTHIQRNLCPYYNHLLRKKQSFYSGNEHLHTPTQTPSSTTTPPTNNINLSANNKNPPSGEFLSPRNNNKNNSSKANTHNRKTQFSSPNQNSMNRFGLLQNQREEDEGVDINDLDNDEPIQMARSSSRSRNTKATTSSSPSNNRYTNKSKSQSQKKSSKPTKTIATTPKRNREESKSKVVIFELESDDEMADSDENQHTAKKANINNSLTTTFTPTPPTKEQTLLLKQALATANFKHTCTSTNKSTHTTPILSTTVEVCQYLAQLQNKIIPSRDDLHKNAFNPTNLTCDLPGKPRGFKNPQECLDQDLEDATPTQIQLTQEQINNNNIPEILAPYLFTLIIVYLWEHNIELYLHDIECITTSTQTTSPATEINTIALSENTNTMSNTDTTTTLTTSNKQVTKTAITPSKNSNSKITNTTTHTFVLKNEHSHLHPSRARPTRNQTDLHLIRIHSKNAPPYYTVASQRT
jgi:hypothetical protein